MSKNKFLTAVLRYLTQYIYLYKFHKSRLLKLNHTKKAIYFYKQITFLLYFLTLRVLINAFEKTLNYYSIHHSNYLTSILL